MTLKSPEVSVIIPTYNRSEMLKRAIHSVFEQTYKNYEIIVVDDGSTDITKDMVREFGQKNIKYIRNDINKGGAFSRNLGLDNSKGKYISFLDSDDEWLPKKLQKQIITFENSSEKVGVVYSQVLDYSYTFKKNTAPTKRGEVYPDLLQGWCPPTTSSFIIKSEAFKNGTRFDENLSSFQDYDLWIQLAKYWEFEFVPEPLVIFHHHEEPRVSLDLLPRINSLEYFLNKWRNNICEVGGNKSIDFIRNKYLSIIYSHATLIALRNHERIIAFQLLKNMFKTRRIKLTFLVKFIILFIGNDALIKFSRLIRSYFERSYVISA